MAWSLGEDSYDWSHIRAMSAELAKGGYGSGEPSVHHSQPMIPAPASSPSSPATNSAPIEAGPVDPKAPNVASAVPVPVPAKPLNVLFVDGTSQGPAGDHASLPGSPSDFVVSPNPNSSSEQASTPQQNQPLEPVAPKQMLPLQSVAPAAPTQQAPSSSSGLPFSPEFLAAVKAAAGSKKTSLMGVVARVKRWMMMNCEVSGGEDDPALGPVLGGGRLSMGRRGMRV